MNGNSPEGYIFVPGTKAYTIYLGRKEQKETCKACNGKGEIILSDKKEYMCPACSGWGYHNVNTPDEWLLEEAKTITHIDVRLDEIVYFFSCNGYKAENVFLVKKEALKEANRRNKILREKEKLENSING